MRTAGVLILGAIMGAAVVWLWGREMEAYLEERTRGVRTKVAEGVRVVEETAGKVLDRGGDVLHRADEFLQDTKEQVGEALRAGEEAIRPAPAGEKHDQEREESAGEPVTLVGVALIILGALALAYQGITCTTREKVIGLGPLTASVISNWRCVLPNRSDAREGAVVTR